MTSLPIAKSTAVTSAPVSTSRHASTTSGRNLNNRANSAVVTASERQTLMACMSTGQPGAHPPSQPPSAAIAALTASDTISRKPMRDHEAEGPEPGNEELLQLSIRRRGDAPDRVEGRLQLQECSACGQHERDTADNGGYRAFLALRGALQQRLHGLAAFGPDQAINLADDLATRRVGPEDACPQSRSRRSGPAQSQTACRTPPRRRAARRCRSTTRPARLRECAASSWADRRLFHRPGPRSRAPRRAWQDHVQVVRRPEARVTVRFRSRSPP